MRRAHRIVLACCAAGGFAVTLPTPPAQARFIPQCKPAHERIGTASTNGTLDYSVSSDYVGRELRNQKRGAVVMAVYDVTATEGSFAAQCTYRPSALTQNYVMATPNAWRIYGYTWSRGVMVRRLVASGGEATDPKRVVNGTFTIRAGERALLEIRSKCADSGIPTVTIPSTGHGFNPRAACATAGVAIAGG